MVEEEIIKFTNQKLELNDKVPPLRKNLYLSKVEMAKLLNSDKKALSYHLNRLFLIGELDPNTCGRILHSNKHKREVRQYNLEVLFSLGYRLKSKEGRLFRRWANGVLKSYLIKGYALSEERLTLSKQNYLNFLCQIMDFDDNLKVLEQLDNIKEKIFFDGEVFDAKSFISNIISKAHKHIILIDPYVDLNTLDYLKYKKGNVSLMIYCSSKSKLSSKDIKDFNKQYGNLCVKKLENYHDRFLFIDSKTLYHLGTSLNYAGRKVFALTKIESPDIFNSIKKSLA